MCTDTDTDTDTTQYILQQYKICNKYINVEKETVSLSISAKFL